MKFKRQNFIIKPFSDFNIIEKPQKVKNRLRIINNLKFKQL